MKTLTSPLQLRPVGYTDAQDESDFPLAIQITNFSESVWYIRLPLPDTTIEKELRAALARTQAALDAAGELLDKSVSLKMPASDGGGCYYCLQDIHTDDCEYFQAHLLYTAALASARGTETG